MRENTPPSSPYNDHLVADDDMVEGEVVDDDELVYYGDLDEFLENEGGDADADDDEFDQQELREEPIRDDAILTFSEHTSAIFCGSFHPTENWAVTGGEDDKAFVWNIDTGEVLYEVQGK
jgi:angio-associated migratory cell protein